MEKKFYAVGETFKDEESGKILKVVEFDGHIHDCDLCAFGTRHFEDNFECCDLLLCSILNRADGKAVHFEEVKGDD